jgi:D-serine deaminase-like pyridoxal phosphate-dependent protein
VSALALLAEATAAGLTLRTDAGHLHWRSDAPPAPDLLAKLRRHKTDVLELLTDVDERAGILEFDGGVPREQAEAQAVAEALARVNSKAGLSLLLPPAEAADER